MYLPEWAQKHKEKYTEIKKIGNGFYKYQVAFRYYRVITSKRMPPILFFRIELFGIILIRKMVIT